MKKLISQARVMFLHNKRGIGFTLPKFTAILSALCECIADIKNMNDTYTVKVSLSAIRKCFHMDYHFCLSFLLPINDFLIEILMVIGGTVCFCVTILHHVQVRNKNRMCNC